MNQQPEDNLLAPAIRLSAERTVFEVELVSAILAQPVAGTAVANQAGLKIEMFDADDLKVIANALRVLVMLKRLTGDDFADKVRIATLAREGLKIFGHWDRAQIADNWKVSSRWSDASLARLLTSWFHSPGHIRHFIGRITEIETRQQLAAEAYRRCRDLLENPQKEQVQIQTPLESRGAA